MVGTDQRSVLLCNRKAKSANDRIFAVFSDHLGSVYGLQRNPFFPKVFLTVADWQTRVRTVIVRNFINDIMVCHVCLDKDLV